MNTENKGIARILASMGTETKSATWRDMDRPNGRNTAIGGDGWEMTIQQAIRFIDSGNTILIQGTRVEVVRDHGGYVRSDANDRLSDNVSALDVRKVAGGCGTFNRYGVRLF